MLRIKKVVSSNAEVTLLLDGRIAGQWVGLLRESVESLIKEGLRPTIDLENICFVDSEGLALIKRLISRGVQQVNAPLFVVEQLKKCDAETD